MNLSSIENILASQKSRRETKVKLSQLDSSHFKINRKVIYEDFV